MSVQEEQLFGAPLGNVADVTVSTVRYQGGRAGVIVYVHQENRKQLLTLRVTATEEQGIPTVIGALVPLLQRGVTSSVSYARRFLWATHDRMGMMGYEVELKNCGHRPKH